MKNKIGRIAFSLSIFLLSTQATYLANINDNDAEEEHKQFDERELPPHLNPINEPIGINALPYSEFIEEYSIYYTNPWWFFSSTKVPSDMLKERSIYIPSVYNKERYSSNLIFDGKDGKVVGVYFE